jgi:hypothetical protein
MKKTCQYEAQMAKTLQAEANVHHASSQTSN